MPKPAEQDEKDLDAYIRKNISTNFPGIKVKQILIKSFQKTDQGEVIAGTFADDNSHVYEFFIPKDDPRPLLRRL
jgi:hypothetical protein